MDQLQRSRVEEEPRWRGLGGRAQGSAGNRGGGVIGRNGVGKVLWKDPSLITLIIQDSVRMLSVSIF